MVDEFCCQLCTFLFFGFLFFIGFCVVGLLFTLPRIMHLQELRRMRSNHTRVLQNSLTSYLHELSLCEDNTRIIELLDLIRGSSNRILFLEKDKKTRDRCANILNWVEGFSIKKHQKNLAIEGFSKQIIFDEQSNDFRFSAES